MHALASIRGADDAAGVGGERRVCPDMDGGFNLAKRVGAVATGKDKQQMRRGEGYVKGAEKSSLVTFKGKPCT